MGNLFGQQFQQVAEQLFPMQLAQEVQQVEVLEEQHLSLEQHPQVEHLHGQAEAQQQRTIQHFLLMVETLEHREHMELLEMVLVGQGLL
jgi:hypothetical protein